MAADTDDYKGPDRRRAPRRVMDDQTSDAISEIARHGAELEMVRMMLAEITKKLDTTIDRTRESFITINSKLDKINLQHAMESGFRRGSIYVISSLSGVLGAIGMALWQYYTK